MFVGIEKAGQWVRRMRYLMKTIMMEELKTGGGGVTDKDKMEKDPSLHFSFHDCSRQRL